MFVYIATVKKNVVFLLLKTTMFKSHWFVILVTKMLKKTFKPRRLPRSLNAIINFKKSNLIFLFFKSISLRCCRPKWLEIGAGFHNFSK